MCIIAAKPAGVAMPSEKIIENMWYGNSDGAGFMYADKGSVHIRKGFMDFGSFGRALEEFCKTHDPVKTPLVMHFRITTHGGTKPENCHPFPISDSIGMLTKLECKTRLGVAHNGIIPITPRNGISDTMEYIASQLAPLCRAVPDFYRNKHLIEMIYNATGSRLAFLNERGEIFTVGTFYENEGIKYSNESYKYSYHRDFPYSRSAWDCLDEDWPLEHGHGITGWSDDIEAQYSHSLNGYFTTKPVMWLDSDFGYLTGVDVYDSEEMFALDEDNNVYEYDYELDALRKISGACAYSNTGTILRFDPKSQTTINELVYAECSGREQKNRK